MCRQETLPPLSAKSSTSSTKLRSRNNLLAKLQKPLIVNKLKNPETDPFYAAAKSKYLSQHQVQEDQGLILRFIVRLLTLIFNRKLLQENNNRLNFCQTSKTQTATRKRKLPQSSEESFATNFYEVLNLRSKKSRLEYRRQGSNDKKRNISSRLTNQRTNQHKYKIQKYSNKSISANLNENNDNSHNSAPSRNTCIDESITTALQFLPQSRQKQKEHLFSGDQFYPQRESGGVTRSLETTSFNTNPLSPSHRCCKPTDSLPALDALEELTSGPRNGSNKRRFRDSISCQFESCEEIASELVSQQTVAFTKAPAEVFESPPRQIPRLLRRTQSAFCQSRNFAEYGKSSISQVRSCCKRNNSWSTLKTCCLNLSPDKTNCSNVHFFKPAFPPRVSSAPAVFYDNNLTKDQPESRTKGNTSSQNSDSTVLYSELTKFTELKRPNKEIFDHSSDTFETDLKSDRRDISEKQGGLILTYDAIRKQEVADKLSIGCESLPSTSCATSRPTANTNKINRSIFFHDNSSVVKKSENRKRFLKTKSQHVDAEKEDYFDKNSNLDCDIATFVQYLCRISPIDDTCSHCGSQKPDHLPLCHNVTLEENSFKNKISKQQNHQNKNFLENPIRVLTQRKSLLPTKSYLNCKKKTQSKSFQFFVRDNSKKNNHKSSTSALTDHRIFHQRSHNNHHVVEDTLNYPSHNHSAEGHCCDAFCLIFGRSDLLKRAPGLDITKHLYSGKSSSTENSNLSVSSSPQTEMGCVHSLAQKKKVEPCRTSIFSDVKATIDPSPTIIEEYSPIVLRYRTPYFRAHAQVIMPPIRNHETWTVGWIQACDYMKFINQYGNLGCSSWEIPALKSGRIPAVSDSDGVSYPWYGNTTEIATIVGPTETYRKMNLTMNDNFYPSVTWDIPVSEGTNAHLTKIVRDQSFITWLAAINETTKEIIVLKTVRWKFYLEIDIDPTKELGQRACIVAPRIQKQPLITGGPSEKGRFHYSPAKSRRRGASGDNNSNSNYVGQIPISALVRPSANNAQTLIWRPAGSHPVVVVPAKEEHRDSTELVLFNGCSAMIGKESIIKEISKQELTKIQQLTR